MTILTKPSSIIKKPDVNKVPMEHEHLCDEEKIDVPACSSVHVRHAGPAPGATCFLALIALVVAVTGVTCGLLVYRQFLRVNVRHYQGFCSVPLDARDFGAGGSGGSGGSEAAATQQVRWLSAPDVQLAALPALHSLLEEFDIGDAVERITVDRDGHRINFVHDFNTNTTGIIDDMRCFFMEMDSEVVLPPATLVLHISRGAALDLSPVRRSVRAALPAVSALPPLAAEFAEPCRARPTYRLTRDDGLLVRKRSADEAPAPQYSQFAGRHVQHIHIGNLAAVLASEARPQQAPLVPPLPSL